METRFKWPTREAAFLNIKGRLLAYNSDTGDLRGLVNEEILEAFVMQIIASQRREDYYRLLQAKPISAARSDPDHPLFNPERAVAFHVQNGSRDEACWMIFLMTFFGRHPIHGWKRLSDFYGQLGEGALTWRQFSADPQRVVEWLENNWQSIGGGFGNHRKYESLRPDAMRPFSDVLISYTNLIGENHDSFFNSLQLEKSNDSFDILYNAVNVLGFGRLAKFDFLMLLARYSVLQITPKSAYLQCATGPKLGAKLLFLNNPNATEKWQELQSKLDQLDEELALGMEVLEDAICNWQKSPSEFIHFTG